MYDQQIRKFAVRITRVAWDELIEQHTIANQTTLQKFVRWLEVLMGDSSALS